MTSDQITASIGQFVGNTAVMGLISWVVKNGMTQMATAIRDMAGAVQTFQLSQSAATLKNNQMLTILVYDKIFNSNDPTVANMIKNLITEGMTQPAAPPQA